MKKKCLEPLISQHDLWIFLANLYQLFYKTFFVSNQIKPTLSHFLQSVGFLKSTFDDEDDAIKEILHNSSFSIHLSFDDNPIYYNHPLFPFLIKYQFCNFFKYLREEDRN